MPARARRLGSGDCPSACVALLPASRGHYFNQEGREVPYIPKCQRGKLDPHIDQLIAATNSAGQLNYVLTRLARGFVGEPKYERYNATIGALEAAKLELFRTEVGPYEAIKRVENGDVPTVVDDRAERELIARSYRDHAKRGTTSAAAHTTG